MKIEDKHGYDLSVFMIQAQILWNFPQFGRKVFNSGLEVNNDFITSLHSYAYL